MSIRVSALVVTFQHARYVGEAVRSALAQTFPPHEVVVVDDGSNDGTLDVVRGLADPRVHIVSLPHRGLDSLAATYDAGLEACSGEVVAFLEGDDRWPPDKLEHQVPSFSAPDVVLSHGLYSVIGANGALLHPGVRPGVDVPAGTYDARPLLLCASFIMAVTTMVRRTAVREAGGFRQLRGTPHWDHPTFLALAEQGQFVFVPRVLGEWRRHGRSATFRLAGADLTGVDLSRALALETRDRIGGVGLPDRSAIIHAWDDAHAQMIWQAARILNVEHRYPEARTLALRGLRRRASAGLRARLLLATIASSLHLPIEPLARLALGRSVLRELD